MDGNVIGVAALAVLLFVGRTGYATAQDAHADNNTPDVETLYERARNDP